MPGIMHPVGWWSVRQQTIRVANYDLALEFELMKCVRLFSIQLLDAIVVSSYADYPHTPGNNCLTIFRNMNPSRYNSLTLFFCLNKRSQDSAELAKWFDISFSTGQLSRGNCHGDYAIFDYTILLVYYFLCYNWCITTGRHSLSCVWNSFKNHVIIYHDISSQLYYYNPYMFHFIIHFHNKSLFKMCYTCKGYVTFVWNLENIGKVTRTLTMKVILKI